MAHFRGTIQGGRGEASRLGHKSSGLSVTAASWQGKVTIWLYEKDGVDYARIALAPHSNGAGICRELYDGPIGGEKDKAGFPIFAGSKRRAVA